MQCLREALDGRSMRGEQCEQAMRAQNRKPVPQHGGVDGERGAQVRRESVLRHAWVRAGAE